jgi:hypothetical protein
VTAHPFADCWKAVEAQFLEPLIGPRAWHGRTTVRRLRAFLEMQGVPGRAKDELLALWHRDGRIDIQGDDVALVRRTWRWADIRGLYMYKPWYRVCYARRRRSERMTDWCWRFTSAGLVRH